MFLQEFGRHPNIIKLFNILRADNDRFVLHNDVDLFGNDRACCSDIYLVFEYMEADLHNVS